MYIPDYPFVANMKVQKIVSLDVETAELASRMTNFSAFVRRSIRAEAVGADVASEMQRRMRCWKTAQTLAELAFGYAQFRAKELELELTYENAEQLLAEVHAQTTLEDWK